MVARIHHATAAKAEKLGFVLKVADEGSHYEISCPEHGLRFVALSAPQAVEDMAVARMLKLEYPRLFVRQDAAFDWEISQGRKGEAIGSGKTLQEAWDEACEDYGDEGGMVEFEGEAEEGDEEEEGDGEGKSVVKRKYKSAYRPFKQKCGDELSQLITAHVTVEDPETGENKIDLKKLRRFAKANNAWVDTYANLNPGMQRMNIRNRIAPTWKKDPNAVVWNHG